MIFNCFVLFIVISVVFTEDAVKYDGYKVYQVIPKNVDEAILINSFGNDENFDFWSDIRLLNIPVEIMVSPPAQQEFEGILKEKDIENAIVVNDVSRIVEYEDDRNRVERIASGNISFSEYMRHDEINAYLERLASDYPTIVKKEIIGRSFEGRELILLRITSGGANKPTIFAEAAIHAREWIAPPVALYIINQLVENPENEDLYQDIDWAIIPVLNPDGYEYTHTNERLWRKTRTPGTICYGVDGNRNFDAQWSVIGASRWQCDNTYAGHRVFSEPEVQAVRDFILSHKDDIRLFIDIHSYGRWFLYPYGHTNADPDNVEELRTLGQLFNDAVYAVNGTNYTTISFANGLYFASGTSVDWVKDIGINLAYTLELPESSFIVPPEDIVPIVEETWQGFRALHDYVRNTFIN